MAFNSKVQFAMIPVSADQDTDILHFERKTQGAGGTTAGDGFYLLYYELIPDGNGVA
jgi:hypothetical protein